MQEVYNFNAINNSEIRFRYIILTCLCGRKQNASLNRGERENSLRAHESCQSLVPSINIDNHSVLKG